MKIAITVITISVFIFGAMYVTISDLADQVAAYITANGGGVNK
ncbi:hypothetical protein V6C20_06710 [Caldibacillus thermoamylovorans]